MREFVMGHWSRQVFMTLLVFSCIESVPMMCVHASEEADVGSRVDQAKAQLVREKFMARLEELGDLSKEKERWLSVYAGLEAGAHESDNLLHEMEIELTKAENAPKKWKTLSLLKGSIGQKGSVYRMLQDLAVRQYALLSKFEALDQSLKQKTLSRADYLIERAYLIQQITHIEQLRLWNNLADNVADHLEEIAGEIDELEISVRLK